MQKMVWLMLLSTCCSVPGFCQAYTTRTGFVGFYSKTPFEDIRAENNQVYGVIDVGKKSMAFAMLLKSFVFTKELMQTHFNENYVESDKYPKTTFSGTWTGDLIPEKDGVYPVVVKGNLTLHNVTRAIEEPGTLEVKGGRLMAKSDFTLRPEDFNISIPSIVRDKIAREITVHVKIDFSTSK